MLLSSRCSSWRSPAILRSHNARRATWLSVRERLVSLACRQEPYRIWPCYFVRERRDGRKRQRGDRSKRMQRLHCPAPEFRGGHCKRHYGHSRHDDARHHDHEGDRRVSRHPERRGRGKSHSLPDQFGDVVHLRHQREPHPDRHDNRCHLHLSLVLRTGSPAATTLLLDNNTPIAIPETGIVESPITVSGFAGVVAKVRVSLQLNHTFDFDLRLALVAPDGTVVFLALNRGGAGQNYGTSCSSAATRTTFDDDATTPIAAGSPPFLGTFTPDQSLATFNTKSGPSVNGSWRLRIIDDFTPDGGVLNCWSLLISPAVCGAGTAQCATSTAEAPVAGRAGIRDMACAAARRHAGVPAVPPASTPTAADLAVRLARSIDVSHVAIALEGSDEETRDEAYPSIFDRSRDDAGRLVARPHCRRRPG